MKVSTRHLSSATSRIVIVLAIVMGLMAAPATAFAGVRVWVDPGHGGKDPGAMGGGLKESRVNLAVSKYVIKSIRRQGWAVGASRTTNKFIQLDARPAKAARFKADVFVSIHSNSTGKRPMGSMTIYRSTGGKRLGGSIVKQLSLLTPGKDIGNKADVRGLAVLRGAKMPAVIVELASMTAKRENRMLRDPKSQKAMAEAIVRGIANYEHVRFIPVKSPTKAKPKAAPKATSKATKPTTGKVAPKRPEAAKPKATPTRVKPHATATSKTSTKAAPRLHQRTEPKPQTERRTQPRRVPTAPAASWLTSLLQLLFH